MDTWDGWEDNNFIYLGRFDLFSDVNVRLFHFEASESFIGMSSIFVAVLTDTIQGVPIFEPTSHCS